MKREMGMNNNVIASGSDIHRSGQKCIRFSGRTNDIFVELTAPTALYPSTYVAIWGLQVEIAPARSRARGINFSCSMLVRCDCYTAWSNYSYLPGYLPAADASIVGFWMKTKSREAFAKLTGEAPSDFDTSRDHAIVVGRERES